MAIIADVITETTTFPQQYIRVDSVRTSKTDMHITVGIYLREDLKDNPPHRAEILNGSFDMYAELNLWQQAYIVVKQNWPEHTDV